jgi:TonB family protein
MKSKIKTMKSKQEITDEEIQRLMDFDKLLRERDKFVARQKFLRNIKISGAALGIAILALTLWLSSNRTASIQPIVPAEDKTETVESASSEQSQLTETPSEQKVNGFENKKMQTGKSAEKPEKHIVPDSRPEKTKQAVTGESMKNVYQQPEPVNGYPDLYAYFDKELTYPQTAIKDSVQGVVTVVFLVNEAGKAENIEIENSLGKPFDDEVMRLIGNMPLWKPALYNGKLVKSKVSLPLTFQLRKIHSKN